MEATYGNSQRNHNLTYYRSNTYNQTFYADLSLSSGYSNIPIQSGNIMNEALGMFFVIYALLLALFLYQITHKIHKGPDQEANEDDGTGEGKLQVPFVKD